MLREHGILIALHALVINSHPTAIDLQGCFCPAKLKSAIVNGGTHHALIHHIKPWIAECRLDSIRTVPLLEDVLVGDDLSLAWLIGLHGPVHHVDPMGKQVCHSSSAEIPEPSPAVELFLAERLVRRRSEP